jgi:type II secretory pathway component PulF
MTTVLEPFIILFVGILVAVLLVAMYLPMFQLSSAIG